MAKPRDGFHDLFAQIPDQLWTALGEEADENEVSITAMLIRILRERYPQVTSLPKRKRAGRPPG
jgi:hypothetical protein